MLCRKVIDQFCDEDCDQGHDHDKGRDRIQIRDRDRVDLYHTKRSAIWIEIAIKDAIAIRWMCTTPRDLRLFSRRVHEVDHVVQRDDSRSGPPGKHNGRSGLTGQTLNRVEFALNQTCRFLFWVVLLATRRRESCIL